ncbi:MAG: hypothetical protein K8S94_04585 [Planctomycetia bacterium]|nr:hypothetical protein [Planctomycetia bacterium]
MLPGDHKWNRWILVRQAAILAGITLAVFSTTLSAGFVYDARLQILTDPFLHDPWNWPSVLSFRVLGMDVLDFNRPVHLASLMLDAAVWGRESFGYHLSSILLHALNVVLVWLVVQAVLTGHEERRDEDEPQTSRSLAAFLAALSFAVHPVVVEAVCEPTFREDLLAAAFTLGAVVLAAGHAAAAGAESRRAVGCVIMCLLAVASKESGVAAPVVLAAFWWLFRGGERTRFWSVAIGGGLVLVAAFLAARFLLEPSPSRIFETKPDYPGGSFAEVLKIEPRILALYAQLIVFPVNLCADYGLYSVRHLPLWASLVVLAVLGLLAAFAVRQDRRILFGLVLLLGPLVPVSNLVPIYRAAADRYLYLPLAGVACIAACVLDSAWAARNELRRQTVMTGSLAAIVVLAAICLGRQAVWASQLALWENTFQRIPTSYTAAHGYSSALRAAGRNEEAVALARRAIELSDGKRGDAWLTLALALDAAGQATEADKMTAKAVEIDGRLADPDARVAALAMERDEAEEVKRILTRTSSAIR